MVSPIRGAALSLLLLGVLGFEMPDSAANKPTKAVYANLVDDETKKELDQELIKLMSSKSETNPSQVEDLIVDGASPSAIGEYNYTALMWGCVRHKTAAIRVLLEKGADIEHTNAWGRNAMFICAWEGQTEAIELLLKHGANVSASAEHDRWTTLHKAVEMGHTEMVRVLLEGGADPNAVTLPDKKFPEGVSVLALAKKKSIRAVLKGNMLEDSSKDEL